MNQLPLGKRCFYANFGEDIPEYELLRGTWKPKEPLLANWVMGKPEPEDIARGQTVTWFFLSPKIQRLFADHHLTGWSTYPLELRNKYHQICSEYKGFCITGRSGPIDKEKGNLSLGESPDDSFARRTGIFFEKSSWDGSDFFCPAGNNAYMFVTEQVVDIFAEHRIGGFEFAPLSKATWIP